MKNTTKKIYCLASACAIVVLSLLLMVGALMPTFKLNMASARPSELFGQCSLTSELVLDEANVGVGNLIGVVTNLSDVKVINKIAFAEMDIRDIQMSIAEVELDKAEAMADALARGDADPDLSSYDKSIENYKKEMKEVQKELDDFKKEVGEDNLKALSEKLKDEGFQKKVYTYMVVFATYENILWSGSSENPTYMQYYHDTLTTTLTLLSMGLLAITIIASVVWAIVVVIGLVKCALAFLGGYKGVNAAMLDKMFPMLATSMVAFPLFTFVFTKLLMGSAIVMGAGLKFSIVIVALLALVRIANKLLLSERCDAKKIVRTLITLVSIVLVFCSMNAITNLGLYDAHMRSSNEITPIAVKAKEAELIEQKTAELTERLLKEGKIPTISEINSIKSSAEHEAKTYVTAQKLENVIPVVAVPLLMGILAVIVLSCLLERLADKQYKTKTGAIKNYRPAFVVCAIILVCAVFVSTLGVGTVKERDDAYAEEGVHFIWNEYEADNSVAKLEYEALVKAGDETAKAADELADKVKNESNETAKAELAYQQNKAERVNNLCVLATEAVSQNQKGLNTSIIILSILLVALEILYMISPKLVDKFVPASLKEKLAGFAAEPEVEETSVEEAAPVEEVAPEAAE